MGLVLKFEQWWVFDILTVLMTMTASYNKVTLPRSEHRKPAS